MKKILINASNLHVGGGVQVAVSFISMLINNNKNESNITIWASNEVMENLSRMNLSGEKLFPIENINSYGIRVLFDKKFKIEINEFDAVFTIFGPLYIFNLKGVNIVGFAQPWIIYPKNEIYSTLKFANKVFTRLKFWIQTKFFMNSDLFVVELDHVCEKLLENKIAPLSNIKIVNNCLSEIYFDDAVWCDLVFPETSSKLKIGFVGRNYAHKNTKIFPYLLKYLRENYGIHADIFVTFSENDWNECSEFFKENIINVGEIFVNQCPAFYKKIDVVVFPSLLECFSATPLEAMAMSKPLFVSDKQFNRDICKEHAFYFDATSPEHAAKIIAKNYLSGDMFNADRLQKANIYARNYSNSKIRHDKYLQIINESLIF